MQITKLVLISDVINRLTQGKPSSDLELEQAQVAFIIDQVRWNLVTQKLNEQLKKGYPIDPVYSYTQYNTVPTLIPLMNTRYQTNIQVGLSYVPLSLYRDRAIMRVFATPIPPTAPMPQLSIPIDFGSPVDMVAISQLDDIKALKFGKPALNNLKYTREGQTLWIYGLTQDTYKMVQFTITYMPRMSLLEDLNDNDPVPITEDLYEPIVEGATKICYAQLYNSGMDTSDNATQDLKNNLMAQPTTR